MERQDLYSYYCVTEGVFVQESVTAGDPQPSVCINNAGHTVDFATLKFIYRVPRKTELGLSAVENLMSDAVGVSDTQTLTKKTLTDNTTFFQDNIDNTKKLQFECANITTATTRTLTVPDVNTTIVGTGSTQTLTNKTINSTTNTVSANNLFSATTAVNVSAAAAPTTGQVLRATSGTAATWQTFPIFGMGYFYGEDNSTSSTSSSTFQQKLRLTTGSLAAGTYRIGWYYQWRISVTNNDFIARVQVDDSTTLFTHQQEPQDSGGDQAHQGCGFRHLALTAGVHNIDLDYSTDGSGTSFIWNSRLEIWRVA